MVSQEKHIQILVRSLDIQKLEYSIKLEQIKVDKEIKAFDLISEYIDINQHGSINTKIFMRLYSLRIQLEWLLNNETKTLADFNKE